MEYEILGGIIRNGMTHLGGSIQKRMPNLGGTKQNRMPHSGGTIQNNVVLQNARQEPRLVCQPIGPFADRQELLSGCFRLRPM